MGNVIRRFLPALLLVSGSAASPQDPGAQGKAGLDHYETRIRPILEERCYTCHSAKAEKLKGGLRLDTYEGLIEGGDTGPAVVPGNLEKSLIVRAVRGADEDLRMPPKGDRLTAAQVGDVEAWIKMGAPHPRKKGGESVRREDVWAFEPLKRPSVPAAAAHPVDAFVLEKLKAKGLGPAAAADPVTLLRRATIDLTGLPPTPAEIDDFLKDGGWEKVVDRLLASPHYGEQGARHWLDVVRYADTAGFSNDYERPNAWRYRDYVVRSLNADKPFGRFILEQLAGDEIDASDPEMLVAVGFLRMGPWEHTAMSVAAETRQYWLDDITHSTAATFLGLTMRCCRCHDHKFDPIPTKDYYRLQAVFAPTHFAERDAPFLASEDASGFDEGKAEVQRRLKEKGYRPLSDQDDPKIRKSLEKVGTKRREHLEREVKRFEPIALSVYTGPSNNFLSNRVLNRMPAKREGPVQEIAILRGGALDAPGEKVGPGVPGAVKGTAAEVPETPEGRRLALARWLADPGNPLTARVVVNRVWQQHFAGKGIVATPNNFGKMGKRPTHPELLDWLAGWFLENGSSIKKLHRLILTSETYRRSGTPADPAATRKLDAANDLLGHYPPRRLAAEEIRDGMLAITGELNRAVGGPGVFPEINWEVALQPRHVMGGPAPSYQPSPRPEDRHRRTLYAFRIRTLADPMLEVLNRPGTELSCERRDETTIAPQAFALLNSQFSHDRALALARRVEKEPSPIDAAFRLVVGRRPDEDERRRCREHFDAMTGHHRRHAPVRVDLPTSVRREMIEEFTGDLVRWDEELDLMRNYRRDLQPWDVGPETRALADVCLVLLNSNEFLYVR
jgi:mono/diheme cytochrome c family protein